MIIFKIKDDFADNYRERIAQNMTNEAYTLVLDLAQNIDSLTGKLVLATEFSSLNPEQVHNAVHELVTIGVLEIESETKQ